MKNHVTSSIGQPVGMALSLLSWHLCQGTVHANPTGGTVSQGSASFKSSGSQFTITTPGNAYINWQTFNIAAGETTTFAQPSASSVVWNQINDANPSQILGTINANGFVVLQNQSGFVVGGQAAINAHGLVMTTAPSAVPNLASGGAWSFSAPPPSAKIINYGQINTTGGGPAFLIASDIENQNSGTISAPGGRIGLYAGETVLVSPTPDGRSLSAQVTLPQGSVDNEGKLIADAGTIAALAQTVNQNGLVQANSVQNVNGVIELVASDSLTLGATSSISAQGDATTTAPSTGGMVLLQSDNTFADNAGSTLNVAGQAGGQDGLIEISGNGAGALQSTLSSYYALLINPFDLTLSGNPTDTSIVDPNDATKTNPNLNVSDLANYSQIDLRAQDNIELAAPLTLPDATSAASLKLTAGNNLTLDPGANITAGKKWAVNLTAGTALPANTLPVAGNDGIYLNGGAYVQTQDGDISATAANEIIIQDSTTDPITGAILTPSGAIRTIGGGNIDVTAQLGNVNSGDDVNGFTFGLTAAPWYKVNSSNLGGISTAAGGDVTITAGGSVTSYLPTQYDYNANHGAGYDGGSGAFGGGNVTINAGGAVVGNYVLANGLGSIAAGGNAGVPITDTDHEGFALSLVKGSWTVSAPNIYLADVLNPNGVFNDASTKPQYGRGGVLLPSAGPGAHLFNYDSAAAVTLNGANAVEITGAQVPLIPHDPDAATINVDLPVLFPPSLTINAGSGGITLDTSVILFPSAQGNVNLTTTAGGNFSSRQNPNDPNDVVAYSFQMSDSGKSQFSPLVGTDEATEDFGYSDHAATPPELNNPNPVEISIAGSIDNLNIYTTKETDLTVHGNMFNGSFVGENLHASDVTTVTVDGSISFSPLFALTTLTANLPAADFDLLPKVVNYNPGLNSVANPVPASDLKNPLALNALALSDTIENAYNAGSNLGFVYNDYTLQLGFAYQMNATLYGLLKQPLETIQYAFGRPLVALGQTSLGQNPADFYFVTTPVTFDPLTIPAGSAPGSVPVSAVDALYQGSRTSVADAEHLPTGFQIGGPGLFVVNAGSMDLGASGGIVSWGGGNGSQSVGGGVNYANLDAPTGATGASIDVSVAGNLGMLTSTIATIGGGDVNVNSSGGEIDLGLKGVPFTPPNAGNLAYGIYSAAAGDVTVTANKDINVDTARIATFNGGNISVESYNGDVNAGNGVNEDLQVLEYYPDNGILAATPEMTGPRPYGSGILALVPSAQFQVPGSSGLPGSITVTTPNGDIVSTLGGISQFALNGSIAGGPNVFVDLTAGTPGVPYFMDPSGLTKDSAGHVQYGLSVNGVFKPEGNIDLGKGGVVGGTVDLNAQGNIAGLVVSRQNSTVTSPQAVAVTVVSGGSASVSGGSVSGLVIAQSSASVSGTDSGVTVMSESTSGSAGVANSVVAATASTTATGAGAEAGKTLTTTSATDSDGLEKKKGSATLKVKRVTVILPPNTTADRQTSPDAI